MSHKNFGWIVTWRVTDRCNLNCAYCDQTVNHSPNYKEEINYPQIIEKLEAYRPKILNITGGEPTQVTELPAYLEIIKKKWGPFIRVVHNGTNLSGASALFPFIDRLVISIDGPGAINHANRGVDGDRILQNIGTALDNARKQQVQVILNCVVTTQNAPHIEALVRNAGKLSKDIQLSFMPVMPPLGDNSILVNKDMYDSFLSTFERLRSEGYNIMHVFDTVLRHKDLHSIACYNQFFTLRMETNGSLSSCAMNIPADPLFFAQKLRRFLTNRNVKNVYDRLRKMFMNTVSSSPDFTCSTICNCESWLDLLFLGVESNCHAVYTEGLRGRITDKEYDDVDQFVRKHINPEFDIRWFKTMIEHGAAQHQAVI